MLDFNAVQQPTWPLRLKDDAQTVVHLATPSVALVDRLMASVSELEEVTKTKDGRVIKAIYGLVADIMNVNEDGFTFTAEELSMKYHMSLHDVFLFVSGYFDFIKEIQEAKN
jgi:hypothetical protein